MPLKRSLSLLIDTFRQKLAGLTSCGLKHRWIFRCLIGVSVLPGGCGSVDTRPVTGSDWTREAHVTASATVRQALAAASDCCRTLRDLPFGELRQDGTLDIDIGPDSPAHQFASGKSFFAAFRIPASSHPLRIEVSSFRAAEPGSFLQKAMPDTRQTVLQPTILLLDDAFEVVRRVDAMTPRTECQTKWAEPAFRTSVVVNGAPSDAAYLVLVASGESQALDGQTVCGMVRHGMDPVGSLEIRTRALPVDDAPVRMSLPVNWYPDTQRGDEVGFWQFMVAEPRLLVLGQQGLHVLTSDGDRYRHEHSIPYARLARATAVDRQGQSLQSFSVAALEDLPGQGNGLRHHTFETNVSDGDGSERLDQVSTFLTTRIRPALVAQTITWRILPDAPAMNVEGGFPARVRESAVAGGMATALPCGLCQTGACPPEMLLPCAGLFGVGALLGGAAGTVRELLSDTPPGESNRQQVLTIVDGRTPFGPVQLGKCLADEIERTGGSRWQDAGLSASSTVESGEARPPAAGMTAGSANTRTRTGHLSEVALRDLTLVRQPSDSAAPAAATAPAPWQLHIEAQLRFVEPESGRQQVRRVDWSSEAIPDSAWSNNSSSTWSRIAAEGCAQLSRRLLDAAEKVWRGQ